MSSSPILVCFAVKEEANPFRRLVEGRPGIEVLVTGMGKHNAERSLREALGKTQPALVLSSGFAGGLKPQFTTGAVVFADAEPELARKLAAGGGMTATFHCAERVAISAEEKRALHQATGADAVEMESGVMRSVCREHQVPFAIVRVILDAADEDLPLDFNALLNEDQQMDGRKLALALMKSPGKIPALLRLQKQSSFAAERLAEVLFRITN